MLTNRQIECAKPKEKLHRLLDGLGLYLEIFPNGTKTWRLRYRYLSREKRMTLGRFPETSLVEARAKRDEARKLLENDVDPAIQRIERRNAALTRSGNSFEVVAREWHDLHKERWCKRHAQNILNRLENDIFPPLGKIPVADIKPIHLLNALRSIEQRGAHEIARRVLQFCGQVFRYAVITERATRDITTDLRGALKPFLKGHFSAIETDELPLFLQAFYGNDARLYPQTRNALQLMMLTFVRTGELIGAKWDEINLEKQVWSIPAERMKMRRPHIVPLSRQAIETLRRQKELTGRWEWVFPNIAYPRKHMSNCTILAALKRLGYRGRMTGHGFRALAMSTIKEKLRYRHEVIDRQLAHAPVSRVDAAYDRAKFLDERAVMMQDWADYLDKMAGQETSNVSYVAFVSQSNGQLNVGLETHSLV